MPSFDNALLAVGLGANRPSVVGEPSETLSAMKPLLEIELAEWAGQPLSFRWSELKVTAPVGPIEQPRYLNGVLLVREIAEQPSEPRALQLLDRLLRLERRFGRDRQREQRWGPRTLDLDLLFWGEFRLDHQRLVLPHPRMHLRTFVLEPLLQAMHAAHPPCW